MEKKKKRKGEAGPSGPSFDEFEMHAFLSQKVEVCLGNSEDSETNMGNYEEETGESPMDLEHQTQMQIRKLSNSHPAYTPCNRNQRKSPMKPRLLKQKSPSVSADSNERKSYKYFFNWNMSGNDGILICMCWISFSVFFYGQR